MFGGAHGGRSGDNWEQVEGSMVYVAAAEENIVWGIDPYGEVWRHKKGEISLAATENEDFWNEVGAETDMVQVSVGKHNHVVGYNNKNQIFFREGVTKTNLGGTGWMDISYPGIDVYWITMGANGQIYIGAKAQAGKMKGVRRIFYRTQVTDEDPSGESWREFSEGEGVSHIVSGAPNALWGLSSTIGGADSL